MSARWLIAVAVLLVGSLADAAPYTPAPGVATRYAGVPNSSYPGFYRPNYLPNYAGLGYGSGSMGYGYQSLGYGFGSPESPWYGSYYLPWNGYYGGTIGYGFTYGTAPYLFNGYRGRWGTGYGGSYYQNYQW
ncbi:MAG TPA: hypothetical protein VHZ24_08595 [Pirellulales bacterium]|jgi:hypothetical protein|nr:hypothetical protein [Pirellulales bacterium]